MLLLVRLRFGLSLWRSFRRLLMDAGHRTPPRCVRYARDIAERPCPMGAQGIRLSAGKMSIGGEALFIECGCSHILLTGSCSGESRRFRSGNGDKRVRCRCTVFHGSGHGDAQIAKELGIGVCVFLAREQASRSSGLSLFRRGQEGNAWVMRRLCRSVCLDGIFGAGQYMRLCLHSYI